MIAFYQGLKEEVKDEWVHYKRLTTMQDVVTLAEKGGRKNVMVRYRKKVTRATNRQD
ncbi:hypothetical protein M501DRAFT_1002199 [Patellaria atrata CBS 101060]|uniref:Uncharacterized protein n=1 Tax=Patellaria atrata CBS 101060 TaxID=1346257 RepID=A0A9P4S2F8_9PEZI|nr:hypothetical protein M501DRAFT_1002199 [Patellaria atrata CBS 101060]